MKSILKISYYIILTSFLISCSAGYIENSNFEGNWVKIKPVTAMAGYNYNVKFQSDSFFYKIQFYGCVAEEPCQPEGTWKQYSTGKYFTSNGIIYMNGYWTDSTYRNIKDTGCFNTGKFKDNFSYSFTGLDTLLINKRKYKDERHPDVYDHLIFVRTN